MAENKIVKLIPYKQLHRAKYNRDITRGRIDDIKRKYNPLLADNAKVSFRDGLYWVVDHQHLATAQYELNGSDPDTLISCEVLCGLTYEQEADLFHEYNTSSKPLSFSEDLNGLIEAGNVNAVAFRDTVEACGYFLKKTLTAVQKAWNIFNTANGARKLAEILTTTNACWPGDRSGVQNDMLSGLEVFFRNHPECKRDRLIKALSQYRPSELIQKANAYYNQMDSRSFTKPYCTYVIIVNAYNKGLRGSTKLIPATPVM